MQAALVEISAAYVGAIRTYSRERTSSWLHPARDGRACLMYRLDKHLLM